DVLSDTDLFALPRAFLVLAIGETGQRRVLVQPAEAPALEESRAVDSAEDGHADLRELARDVGFLAAPSLARLDAHGPHTADDGAARDGDGVVARVHRLGIRGGATDGDDLGALGLEGGNHGVVLRLHLGEVGRLLVPVVPLLLVVYERIDGRIVLVSRHHADLVA